MANTLEASETELKEIFDSFDANKDGTICVKELKAVFNRLGYTWFGDADIEKLMAKIDSDGSKTMDFSEFKKMTTALAPACKAQTLYAQQDEDGDGLYTVADIVKQMKGWGLQVSEEDAKSLFTPDDLNGDGQISYTEFLSKLALQNLFDAVY